MRFNNRVVIVTGGAKGIGGGCSRVFAGEGGRVAILDRDERAAFQLADELTAAGPGSAKTYRCDVSQPEEVRETIDRVVSDFGRIDCLINNAGMHPPSLLLNETSLDILETVWRVNFVSTFVASQCAVPHLKVTQGTIVNISSMTAVLGQHGSTAYAATKAAQVGFTKSLAIELGPHGVRVNAILPSNIDTPLMHEWANTLDDPASALDRVAKLQVFGRMGSPEEIGRTALFLATEDSSFLTGQALEVEGGASLDY
jgi:NAD(P)-dependent dehydrogenase (short-subunit alcohol dehydrogenase family)